MMSDNKVRLIITSVLFVLFIALAALLMSMQINLGVFKTNSFATLKQHRDKLEVAQAALASQDLVYNTAVNNVKSGQQKFNTEKKKYDAISDETVEIIKEATTEENYNIEYMWVKLGNYAKKNNLSIIVAEPGNTLPATTTPDQKTDETQTNNTETKSTADNTTPKADTTSGTEGTQTPTPTPPATNTSSTAFKIQVTGTYIDVSDFIFEVENDKELRFKLDNIKMELVDGSTIKATFDVKNLLIKK